MTDAPDPDLLEQFARENSETVFTALVERHIGLVHSVALRHTADPQHAQDITQAVFIILARKAASLNRKTVLPGWLYHTARLTAANFRRAETSRIRREQEAYMQSTLQESPPDALWSEMSPLLDEAMSHLAARDRDALVLRYFQNKSLAEVGATMGLKEHAAQKRVARAIEKLRKFFGKRGVTLSGAAIAGAVSANSVQAAPAALVKTISAVAIVKGAAASGSSLTLKGVLKLIAGTKTKTATIGLFGVFFAPVIGMLAGALGTKISIDRARSPRDKRFRVKMAWINWSLVLAFYVLLTGGIFLGRPYWTTHPVLLPWAIISLAFGYGILIVWLAFWASGRQRRIGLEEAAGPSLGAVSSGSRSIEYRSPWTLLGWPLIHIHFGGPVGPQLPAKGWIACGNVAYGILFASGGIAVGAVSMGGIAVGGVAIGGCSVGLLTFGGMAFGLFATGGLAVGYMACGGAAIAWLAACGGAAVAHNFALGGAALAQHANDPAARTFARNSVLLSHAFLFVNLSILLSCLSMVPEVLYRRKQSRQQRGGR